MNTEEVKNVSLKSSTSKATDYTQGFGNESFSSHSDISNNEAEERLNLAYVKLVEYMKVLSQDK